MEQKGKTNKKSIRVTPWSPELCSGGTKKSCEVPLLNSSSQSSFGEQPQLSQNPSHGTDAAKVITLCFPDIPPKPIQTHKNLKGSGSSNPFPTSCCPLAALCL